MLYKCSLPDCKFSGYSAVSKSTHETWHIRKHEAFRDMDGSLKAIGVDIVTTNDPPAGTASPLPFDLATLTPEQLATLREQLSIPSTVTDAQVVEPPHSCSTTRGVDAMKRAVVLLQLAEMVEDATHPDQLLQMVSTMRDMPMMERMR